jgi:hypothetical protein
MHQPAPRARAAVFCSVALLLLHAARSQLPPEWQQGVADSDILFSPDDAFAAVPSNIQATIGNGFLATQMRRYSNTIHPCHAPTSVPFPKIPTAPPNLSHSTELFIAGVYNGAATTDPSHRALVPPPFNIEVQASDSSYRVSTVATGVLPASFIPASSFLPALFITASFFLLAFNRLIPQQGCSCALPTMSAAST